MNFTKTLLVVSGISLLLSCNSSSLSNAQITTLNNIGAKILIQQDPYRENINHISIYLFDKKDKQIGNENIKIRVNNKDLSLGIKKGLYYTKSMRYTGNNIPFSDDYYFELMLSDSTIVPLAYIKAIPLVKKEFITYKKEIPIDSVTTVAWDSLKAFNHLAIWKSTKENDSNTYSGGPYAESTIRQKIEGSGSYTVPLSYYRDSTTTITDLTFEFHAMKQGLIHPDLLPKSNITVKSGIERRIRILSDETEPKVDEKPQRATE